MNAIIKWIDILVKVSRQDARRNRESIINAAGIAFRSRGVAVASVAEVAKLAGLTHGALYRHFPDKDALAASAIEAGFDRIVALLADLKQKGQPAAEYARIYLGRDHRDHFDWGCPAAPLAAEIQRLDERVQVAFTDGLERNLAALASLTGIDDTTAAREKAIVMLALLAGAMALSRASKKISPDLSDEILGTVRRQVTGDER